MRIVKIGKKKYRIPRTWSEVDKVCLLKLISILFIAKPNTQEQYYALLNVFVPTRILDSISEDYLESLSELVAWMPTTPLLNITCTHYGKYYLPEENGKYLSAIEYAQLRFLLTQIKDKPDSILDITANFMRPRKSRKQIESQTFDGDIRVKYNSYHIDREKEAIKKLPIEVAMLCTLYAIAIVNHINTQYKSLFDPSEESNTEEESPIKTQSANTMLMDFHLISQISKSGQYGDYEATCLTPIHTLFSNLLIEKMMKK
jgi:hypothetical protein